MKDGDFYPSPLLHSFRYCQDTVIKIARKLGMEVKETLCTRDDLYLADEAFFTGTAAESTPIREVDEEQLAQENEER